MDMHAYALQAADGKEKWKTEKLYGAGFHSWWPVIWRDRVIFATGHNYRNGLSPGSEDCESAKRGGYYHDAEYQTIFGRLGEQDYIGPTGTEPGDWVKGTFTIDATRAAKYFGQKPWRGKGDSPHFHTAGNGCSPLLLATGKDWEADLDGDGKPECAPFLWTGSKNGVPPPPMVSGFDNVLYRHNQYAAQRGARSQIAGWKFAAPFVSRITSDYGASDEPHIASGGGKGGCTHFRLYGNGGCPLFRHGKGDSPLFAKARKGYSPL